MDIMTRHLMTVENVKTITVDESLVLVDPRSGHYYGLNEVGAAIWRLMERGHAPAVIVESISSEYDASEVVVAADTRRMLSELFDAGLIQ